MESKDLSINETEVLDKAVDEYRENGVTKQICPRCGGKLHYIERGSSYRIYCENESKCGVWNSIRGI